jgi:hypothetical protein
MVTQMLLAYPLPLYMNLHPECKNSGGKQRINGKDEAGENIWAYKGKPNMESQNQ